MNMSWTVILNPNSQDINPFLFIIFIVFAIYISSAVMPFLRISGWKKNLKKAGSYIHRFDKFSAKPPLKWNEEKRKRRIEQYYTEEKFRITLSWIYSHEAKHLYFIKSGLLSMFAAFISLLMYLFLEALETHILRLLLIIPVIFIIGLIMFIDGLILKYDYDEEISNLLEIR